MKNANDQNFFNFVGGGLRQRVIRYQAECYLPQLNKDRYPNREWISSIGMVFNVVLISLNR